MYALLLAAFVLASFFSKVDSLCVAVYIDGYYPLYSAEACAVESSPFNTATAHTCSRYTCNNASWVAPCSTGEVNTKFECLSGTCKKLYTATCQSNRMLTGETRMGGTCSIPEHSGPEGTKFSCLDNGGEWTWMASLDACEDTN